MNLRTTNVYRKPFGFFAGASVLLLIAGLLPAIAQNNDASATGTLETLNVANGVITMEINGALLNGSTRQAKSEAIHFQTAPETFLTALVFNGAFRATEAGSIALVPEKAVSVPAPLNDSIKQLIIERLSTTDAFEYAVRDAKTGFVFFNIDRNSSDYDANARSLNITGGRLLLSEDFAKRLGRPSDAGAVAGTISIALTMYPIQITSVVNGAAQSAILPARPLSAMPDAGTVAGPDVIVGDLPTMQQFGTAGSQVGISIGTTSCNAGVVNLNWLQLPDNDHPVIPQNLYRMSGGADNTERFEQVGQSWMKHAFTALTQNICSFGCNGTGGAHLGSGCSDPYTASLNSGQTGLGSRSWVNPFTGAYPRGDSATSPNNHTGHSHSGVTHRIIVETSDLNTTLNTGATYFGEGQYVTPHEYAWCQANPGQCNMYNNVSYRQFTVTGTTNFTFASAAATVRAKPAIIAWTGATINQIEPAPGADGIGFVGYKVTNPSAGVWHYEYAVYNENIDRGIQSFSVPIGCGVTTSNVGFHAPLNHPGIANDGTLNSAGYSNAAWTVSQPGGSLTWSSETFAQNQNANALRWGTLYNFRFDSNKPPQAMNATIGFYKNGTPITVAVQGPTPQCTALQLVSAVSRKTHGSQDYDIDLPLSGGPGVECRRGGANGDHTLIFTFSNALANGGASITTDKGGSISGSPTFVGNTMTVNLAAVGNAQRVTVNLNGVTDSFGQTMANTGVQVGFLLGDTTGDGSVNVGDALQTRNNSGHALDMTNFRSDVTVDDFINVGDVLVVKGKSGTSLDDPPAPNGKN